MATLLFVQKSVACAICGSVFVSICQVIRDGPIPPLKEKNIYIVQNVCQKR